MFSLVLRERLTRGGVAGRSRERGTKKGREGEKEGERGRCERETSIGCLLYAPQLVIELSIQACARTGNCTDNPSVYGPVLQPAEPLGQGSTYIFLKW